MKVTDDLFKYKKLTKFKIKKQKSLKLITENIGKPLSYLSFITKFSLSTVKKYKKQGRNCYLA